MGQILFHGILDIDTNLEVSPSMYIQVVAKALGYFG